MQFFQEYFCLSTGVRGEHQAWERQRRTRTEEGGRDKLGRDHRRHRV